MLEEEKTKLQRQFNDKRDLLERQLKRENEDRLQALTDHMKSEFNHSQKVGDDRHHD